MRDIGSVLWSMNVHRWEVGVRVRIRPENGAVATDLFEWLRADRISGVQAVTADPETLGALEIVDVVLSQAAAFSSLAVAIASWRQSRPPAPPVTITRPDGSTMRIPSGTEVSAEIMREFLAGGEESGGAAPDQR